ncbi:MAG: hypothetical protein LBH58_06615 [Tannerellaceae bacterium]|jgi:hypothetical protein|nr:hypothetical protein [Tannerellaceae bacterium]
MSHEGTHAGGNRIEGFAHLQGNDTYNTINEMFGLQGDAEFSGQMINAILNPESWKENTGEVDNWIRTAEGGYKYDGVATLKDEEGNVIKSLKDMGLGKESQIEGALLAILSVDKNDSEKVAAVRHMMEASGLIHSYSENPDDWYWTGVREARSVNLVDIATQHEMAEFANLLTVKKHDLTELNRGTTISFAAIVEMMNEVNMDEASIKKFVYSAYDSAIDFLNFADRGGNLSIATQMLSQYLDPDQLDQVQVNREWYNNALISGVNIDGMFPNAVRDKVGFGMSSGLLKLASSSVENAKFFQEEHTGIDFSRGTGIQTPGGYWEFDHSDNHKAYIRLFGGNLMMRVQHLDPAVLDEIPKGKIYGSSEGAAKIFDFPTKSFGSGTGAHVHIDMTRKMPYSKIYVRQFVDPETLKPDPARLEYRYYYYDSNQKKLEKSGLFARY